MTETLPKAYDFTATEQRLYHLVVMGIEIRLPVAGIVDGQAEKARVKKKLTEAKSHIARLESLLESNFAKKGLTEILKNKSGFS